MSLAPAQEATEASVDGPLLIRAWQPDDKVAVALAVTKDYRLQIDLYTPELEPLGTYSISDATALLGRWMQRDMNSPQVGALAEALQLAGRLINVTP